MLSDRGVRQRNGSDCVIAAVANAVGTTYKAVRAAWADTTRGGLTPGEIEYLLGRFGNWRTTFPRRPYDLGRWLKLHPAGRFVIIVDNNPFLPTTHALAVKNGWVFGDHDKGWPVVCYFTHCCRPEAPTS
jgi:hypothetical protein